MMTNKFFALLADSKQVQKANNQDSDSLKERERQALVKEAQRKGGF
ncbi:hypothetical protein [Vibrio zhanjiangensis]|nr:hypothetical protein [Vibrio zhanjiangensis]